MRAVSVTLEEYNIHMSFTKKNYCGETLCGLTISNETIAGIEFEECQFSKCSFVNCNLVECKFLDCNFTECRFSAIKPSGSRFIGVKFSTSLVIGFDWTYASLIEGLEFTGCKINYSNFRLLKLPKIKIENCEAREVQFIETDLSDGIFKNTDFEKSRFFKTDLTNADFRGAKNYSINAYQNTLRKARFSLPEAVALLNGLDIILE